MTVCDAGAKAEPTEHILGQSVKSEQGMWSRGLYQC